MNTSLLQLHPNLPDRLRLMDSSELMAYYNGLADRIEQFDDTLHIFVSGSYSRQRLLSQVEALIEAYPHPDDRPPLFGLPVGIKDIFRCDGFPTGCGSLLPPVLFDGPEATCVTRLKSAGAVVAGKTITTEFAYFEPGPTRNPWNTSHTPGGSSSGSAAGVAAGFFPWALGSQTIGSVIRPAAFCGIVGFKPSLGLIPTDGVIPFSDTVDHVGIFGGSVDGIDSLMNILSPEWQKKDNLPEKQNYTIAVPAGPYLDKAEPTFRTFFEQILKKLDSAGISIKEIPAFDDIEAINKRHQELIAIEFSNVHEPWFEESRHLYRPRTVAIIEKGRRLGEKKDLPSLQSACLDLRQRLAELMKTENIDAWISPSATGEAPAGLGATGNPMMNLPWTHAGMPTITLPVGNGPRGLPLGVQLSGGFMQDSSLLQMAKNIINIQS
jgi:Asp-tRNA(Asn)/Glu-tRNA(Gln) amidotransferase A subunit family amidase